MKRFKRRQAPQPAAVSPETAAPQVAVPDALQPQDDDAPRALHRSGECIPDRCRLELKTWAGLRVAQCSLCKFETFDMTIAASRAALSGRELFPSAETQTEK